MSWGQKALKYKGQRVQHSSAPLHVRTLTITHPHNRPSKIHTRTQTDERWVQRRREQVPLVYFLCVPNVGPGGAPQLNHSRHAVEWEATTLTSLKGAIDTQYSTHTQPRNNTNALTHTYTRAHVQQVPEPRCQGDGSLRLKSGLRHTGRSVRAVSHNALPNNYTTQLMWSLQHGEVFDLCTWPQPLSEL